MQISANQWNNVNSVASISNNQNKYQMTMDSGQERPASGDDLSISSQGSQMANRMQRMRPMDPSEMATQMTEMNTAIEGLELDDLNVDEMSREELEAKVTDISATMNDFRPEGAPEKEVDLDALSDQDLMAMVTGFTNSVSQVDSAVSDMTEMANGGMPPMGQQGPQGAGAPPPPPPNGESSISAYSDSEETEEVALIDSLIAALEADATEEEDSTSAFIDAIYAYLDEDA